jgi:class III poly(R)-hydroxyalkanoic acid synthase PhaC subunit
LLVYALILRPYKLDLIPGNSLVEYLVSEGFDVYLLDWGIPGDKDRNLSFEDYVLDYLPEAVENVLRSSHAGKLTLFGYCQGGTMAAMYAALFPGEKNLVLLATPVDFAPEDPGLFGLWTVLTSERYFDPNLLFDPDPVVETFGNVPGDLPGRLVGAGTSALKPLTGYAGTYASLWERMKQEESLNSLLAVSKWVDDGVPFPGEAFRQWIRDFYQQNKLARGELELRGRRVELSNIACPVLDIAGSKDFICPLSQAYDGTRRERRRGDARPGRRARGSDGRLGGQRGALAAHRRLAGDALGVDEASSMELTFEPSYRPAGNDCEIPGSTARPRRVSIIRRRNGYPGFRAPGTSNALRAVSAVFRTGPITPHSTHRTAQPPSIGSTSKKPLWVHRSTSTGRPVNVSQASFISSSSGFSRR